MAGVCIGFGFVGAWGTECIVARECVMVVMLRLLMSEVLGWLMTDVHVQQQGHCTPQTC